MDTAMISPKGHLQNTWSARCVTSGKADDESTPHIAARVNDRSQIALRFSASDKQIP
jgi:hypothetical protein